MMDHKCSCGAALGEGSICATCAAMIEGNHDQVMIEKAEWIGHIWNLLFPGETDDWDYPAQALRCCSWRIEDLRAAIEAGDLEKAQSLLQSTAGRPPGNGAT